MGKVKPKTETVSDQGFKCPWCGEIDYDLAESLAILMIAELKVRFECTDCGRGFFAHRELVPTFYTRRAEQ